MTRQLAVCADDLGQDAADDEVMLALAARGRLTMLSALSGSPHWRAAAARLGSLPPTVAVGLHFNLTHGTPLSPALRRHWVRCPSLPALIMQAQVGALPRAAIDDELQAQWQAFADAAGKAPAYLDGHQHVHHLPGVRDGVLALAQRHGLPVRNTGRVAGPGLTVKRWLIEATGGRALASALRRHGLAHNALLLGVYDFGPRDLRRLWQGWLAQAPQVGGLLMCHPGAGRAAGDAIAAARRREADHLSGAAFDDDLQQAGISLGPAWTQKSSAG